MTTQNTYASDSGHWYTRDGSPCYEVPRAKGDGMRPATLRDAKKLDLVPSVSGILKQIAKPGLEIWKTKQVMMSALTMPRNEGESEEDFCNRILEEGKEAGKIAAARGTELHTAIEHALHGLETLGWEQHTAAVFNALREAGVDVEMGVAERSFAHPDGYGGRIDLYGPGFMLDFKSKERIEPGKKLAWDEHCQQLASYEHGIGASGLRLLNVFVGVEDCQVVIHEWSQEEKDLALKKFLLLLDYWKLANLK